MKENGIKAFLLAAGLGTRLRPLTYKTPKCLVEIGGEPLLGHWLRKLENIGCEAVLINTHHLSEQVDEFISSRKPSSMKINTIYEPKLLGTAGSLIEYKNFFDDKMGLLIHADNAMEEGLEEFIDAHNNRADNCLLTMLTFTTDRPEDCGIVEVDKNNRMIGFHEKVSKPPGSLANGAVYAFNSELLDSIKRMQIHATDFSKDILPKMVGKVQTWKTDLEYIDIGTPNKLRQAQLIWGKQE